MNEIIPDPQHCGAEVTVPVLLNTHLFFFSKSAKSNRINLLKFRELYLLYLFC
jgi:hypothetical protein